LTVHRVVLLTFQ